MYRSLAAAMLLLALIAPLRRTGQEAEGSKPPTQGQFLVASRGLGDPLFAQSVVLMLPIKEEGSLLVGLIVNKPSKIKVRDLFPDSPELGKVDSVAYFGGPVDAGVGARSAIFRSKTPPGKATLVFGDVYVSFDSSAIVALAHNPEQASTLRVFVGRAQWDPGQFQNEVAVGAWHSLRGGTDSIFTTVPELLWHTLIDRAEPRPVVGRVFPSLPLAMVPAGGESGLCSRF
jgi:putative transcriptional regulator